MATDPPEDSECMRMSAQTHILNDFQRKVSKLFQFLSFYLYVDCHIIQFYTLKKPQTLEQKIKNQFNKN